MFFTIKVYAVAAVQSIFDFVEGVIVDKRYRWEQLSIDLINNFIMNSVGNYIGAKAIYINGRWFQPQNIKSFFTMSYGKKLIEQTGIGAVVVTLIDLVYKGLKGVVK